MLDAIKKALDDGMTSLKASIGEIKTSTEATIKGVTDRLEKLEAAPAKAAAPAFNTIPSVYKGYKLGNQAEEFRKNAGKLEHLTSDEKIDEMSKFWIDFIKAHGRKQDVKAMSDLHDFYAKTALAEGADANGGYLVPEEFYGDLIRISRGKSFLLQNARVINMATDTMNIPKELANVSVAWTNEGIAATQSEPTFSTLQLVAKKLDAFSISSNEMLEDSALDVVGLLNDQFGSAIVLELDNQALNGTGAPLSGVLTAATGYSVVMGAGSTAFSSITADVLSEMISQIDEDYLQGAMFIFNKKVKHYIRTMKDTEGRLIYAMPGANTPGTIWEYPYFESVKAPSTSATSTGFISLANWKYFYLGRKTGGMTVRVDPYTKFKENQTQFGVFTRWAPKIAASKAFTRAVTAAE